MMFRIGHILGSLMGAALPFASAAGDLTVTGDGGESTPGVFPATRAVRPSTDYRFTFAVRRAAQAGGRCLTSGFRGLNVDIVQVGTNWDEHVYVLKTGTQDAQLPVKFGVWRVKGDYFVRGDWRVEEVVPHHAAFEGGVLGDGEMIVGNDYFFDSAWASAAHLSSRPFVGHTRCTFNTDRVDLGANGALDWRFGVAGRQLHSGRISFVRGYHRAGALVFEAARDEGAWMPVLTVEDATNLTSAVSLPANLFPCTNLRVRVSAQGGGGIRLYGLSFRGSLSGAPARVLGATRFARPGEKVPSFAAETPAYYKATSGARLPGGTDYLTLWRESSGSKIAPVRPLPTASAAAVEVAAAANEAEAVQFVLTPRERLSDVAVTLAGDLASDRGARLPAAAVDLLRVGYVEVEMPSSERNLRGAYPDPLPPQTPGLVVAAGRNQPFWVRVKPPKGTAAGRYAGTLVVTGRRENGAAFRLEAPLAVDVFGFAFPDELACKTAFGLYTGFIDQYHRLRTKADRARVYPLYLEAMAAYHLSPYSPALGSSWQVRWQGLEAAKKGDLSRLEPLFDFAQWDAEMAAALARYHFNTFRVGSGLGLGGGDASHRREPELAGFKEGTPAYDVMIAKLLDGFQRHLEEKGWLDKAIVYAFDEPPETDNAFVMNGFAKLKKYAPKLTRFLTSPARRDLVGGPNVWCPIAPDLHAQAADDCRAAGDRFWWYVCTCPRLPYPGLFTDNPGVDLRVWLWQSWAEGIEGVLVWNTNQWDQRAKYPDRAHPQNPYRDAMSWNPQGRPWGNGDGRFFYPPLRAVEEGGKDPVFDAPVGSVRGEMLRDGIEDYEYFAILKRLLAERGASLSPRRRAELAALLTVPKSVYTSLTDYNPDPGAMEGHRRVLARAIESLQ